MTRKPLIFARGISAFLASFAMIVATPPPARSAPAPEIPETTFQTIVQCLAHGREIVMVPGPHCVARKSGEEVAQRAHMPLGEPKWNGDWNTVCQDKNDPRRLPADIIKRIAAQKDVTIAPTGIRIVGAVFCGDSNSAGLDLAGLDLQYSVVIDYSVVNGFLDARNLRIKGDLSFDNAVIIDSLRLNRARVEGSVYGRNSFMDRLYVNDTQVSGTWWHVESVIFSDAEIVRVAISGDLNISKSAFSRLWIQSSRIGGTLKLDESEVRCAYHINSSTFGYLTAIRAGFGMVKTAERPGQSSIDYAWWNRAVSGDQAPYTKQVLESPAIKRIADAKLAKIASSRASDPKQSDPNVVKGCEDTSNSEHLEFYIIDSTVEASFCLTSFVWLTPKNDLPPPTHPVSILALNGTKINGSLTINLWEDLRSNGTAKHKSPDPARVTVGTMQWGHLDFERVSKMHKFEAIGLTASAFTYDFSDNARPYFTYIDGLKFERVHNAKRPCTHESAPKTDMQIELPSANDVIHWLDKNAAPSSQPFIAFVAAFEQAGTSATPLRVAQKTVDLCEKTARWLPIIAPKCPGKRFSPHFIAETKGTSSPLQQATATASAVGDFFSGTGEVVMIGFQWTLYLLADHGLRPAKVVWSVAITLLAFLCSFWFILGIVGFESKAKDDKVSVGQSPVLWPITFMFLFDRLIPAYKIREEHYAIKKVYRKATADEILGGLGAPSEPPYPMYYFGKRVFAWPAGDSELRQVEKWLVVLRIIGLVFTVFLLAAINTLASR